MWEKIIAFGVWLIIIGIAVLYYFYFNALKTIGEAIVYVLPIILFSTIGCLIFSRDQKVVRRSKEKAEFHTAVQLNWAQTLKHDLLTYFLPAIIVSLPILLRQDPNITDVVQAGLVFIALAYLKLLYWHEL